MNKGRRRRREGRREARGESAAEGRIEKACTEAEVPRFEYTTGSR